MKKKYNKAFKQLKKLHKKTPYVDEVLRYIQTKADSKS